MSKHRLVMPGSGRGGLIPRSTAPASNWRAVAGNRLAFDGRKDKSLPFNFSWLIPKQLSGCALPATEEQMHTLSRKEGVTALVSCIEAPNMPPPDMVNGAGMQHHHVEWGDYGVPNIQDIRALCTYMDTVIDGGGRVAVHCFAGKGRTGTALACYLVHRQGMGGDEAIETTRDMRPKSIETEAQEHFIRDYARFHTRKTDKDATA